jgi:hypothetical protein
MAPVRSDHTAEPLFALSALLQSGESWQTAALTALRMVSMGVDPSQPTIGNPGETEQSALDNLHSATLIFCSLASDRYDWFQPKRIWQYFECIQLCCSDCGAEERVLSAKSSFTIAVTEMARATRTASQEILARNDGPPKTLTRQTRLVTVLDAEPPHLILDGKPFPAREVAVKYLDALIRANGERVSFAEFVERNSPRFDSAVATRVLDGLPKEIQPFVDRPGKGRSPRLKVELLKPAQ